MINISLELLMEKGIIFVFFIKLVFEINVILISDFVNFVIFVG